LDISYDSRYNIACIRFRQKPRGVETRHISDEINIADSLTFLSSIRMDLSF